MATETFRREPSGILTFFWALLAIAIFVLIVILWVRLSGRAAVQTDDRATDRIAKREELDKADQERLNAVGFIDQAKGTVHMPIAEAKRLLVTEYKKKQVKPSELKVEPPMPMMAAPDPASTEPPPMALPSAPQGAYTVRFDQPAAPAEAANPGETAPQPAAPAGSSETPAAPAQQPPAPAATPTNANLEAAPPAPAPPAPAPPTPLVPAS